MAYKQIKIIVLVTSLLFPLVTLGNSQFFYFLDQKLYDDYPNSILYYYGWTVSDPLIGVLKCRFNRWPEHLQSIELAHTLSPENIFRRLIDELPIQLAGNFAIRYGSRETTIYEIDPFIIFRWANLPWNNIVTTSFAIGEGISYVSSVPSVEKKNNDNTKRLLNYLMLEATFAYPCYPRLQVALRIHHRSGVFGLYHAGNSGSNVIGLGVRYLFS